MATNDFRPVAVAAGAVILTQAEYLAFLASNPNGWPSGIVPADRLNKTIRQSSVMSAALAQFVSDALSADVLDPDAGVDFTTIAAQILAAVKSAAQAQFLKFKSGLLPSTAGGSSSMTIGAGAANDSTNARTMTLASAMSKTTSAWAAGNGNGGLDTGAIANNTWYHWYLIERPDTGAVDLLFSTNPTTPTMPSGAWTSKRRIASGLTDGSAHWTAFVADEIGGGALRYQWLTPTADVTATNPGTAAVSRTLTVPLGVRVFAELFIGYALDPADGTTLGTCRISDLSLTDVAPAAGNAQITNANPLVGGSGINSWAQVFTDTSSRVRSRVSASGANTLLSIRTGGWVDAYTA